MARRSNKISEDDDDFLVSELELSYDDIRLLDKALDTFIHIDINDAEGAHITTRHRKLAFKLKEYLGGR